MFAATASAVFQNCSDRKVPVAVGGQTTYEALRERLQ